MPLAAATAAVSLAVATVPAASAAPVRSAHTITQDHRAPASLVIDGHVFRPVPVFKSPVRDTAHGQVIVKVDSSNSYEICLYNADTYCLGMLSASIWEDVVIHSINVAIHLVELYEILKGDEAEKTGEEEGGPPEGDGDCFGDTGLNRPTKLLSCNSPHGEYWGFQPVASCYPFCFKLYNTAYHGYATVTHTIDGTPVYVSAPHSWLTWGLFELEG
jgi:hypothetical protein